MSHLDDGIVNVMGESSRRHERRFPQNPKVIIITLRCRSSGNWNQRIIHTIITWQWNATLTGELCLHVVLLRRKSIIIDQGVEEGRKGIIWVIIDVDIIVAVLTVHEPHCRNIICDSSHLIVNVVVIKGVWDRRLVMLTQMVNRMNSLVNSSEIMTRVDDHWRRHRGWRNSESSSSRRRRNNNGWWVERLVSSGINPLANEFFT